jgi:hypothetical protein
MMMAVMMIMMVLMLIKMVMMMMMMMEGALRLFEQGYSFTHCIHGIKFTVVFYFRLTTPSYHLACGFSTSHPILSPSLWYSHLSGNT